MIFVNFKTYQEGTGEKAAKLAKICQTVAQKTSLEIIPLVQTADLFRLSCQALTVWAQAVDDIGFGANTGRVLPEAILAAGAEGVLLNHSENKIPTQIMGTLLPRCRKLGLKSLVCAESIEEAREIEKFKPDYLAYEPSEFIGSQTASVSSAKPEVIKEFIKQIKSLPVLVGAGIHSQKDVKIALELGAKGILVSSSIVLARAPQKKLIDLAEGFKD